VDDRMTDVIAMMKSHDISQVPVLNLDGSLAGLVTEADLLKHLVESDHVHSNDETISEIIYPTHSVFPASESLEKALPSILEEQVVLVTEQDRPVGILTKIDVLDFIAQEI
ncbi:MAG: CBS domain-containing protein, partial [Anaerolineales bacterium]|nr:CBS domain-containing protein [Anaerolineales bacterium]